MGVDGCGWVWVVWMSVGGVDGCGWCGVTCGRCHVWVCGVVPHGLLHHVMLQCFNTSCLPRRYSVPILRTYGVVHRALVSTSFSQSILRLRTYFGPLPRTHCGPGQSGSVRLQDASSQSPGSSQKDTLCLPRTQHPHSKRRSRIECGTAALAGVGQVDRFSFPSGGLVISRSTCPST